MIIAEQVTATDAQQADIAAETTEIMITEESTTDAKAEVACQIKFVDISEQANLKKALIVANHLAIAASNIQVAAVKPLQIDIKASELGVAPAENVAETITGRAAPTRGVSGHC